MKRFAACSTVAPFAATVMWAAAIARAADLDIPALEHALAAEPASISARLQLARAYYEAGRFADAEILFDTVLRFAGLPRDLQSQVEIHARAAEQYLEDEDEAQGRLVGFDYVEAGLGGYGVTSSSATGSSEPDELTYRATLAGGLNYLLSSGYALNGSLDYAARVFDSATTHNDSELNARIGASRALKEGNIALALRGQLFYIGHGDYRHDYGVSLDWRRALDIENEIALGTYVRRRQYPSGPLRDRSRSIAEASAGWTRSLADGAASFSLGAHGGYQYATRRADGHSGFYGVTIGLDWPVNERLGADVAALWEHNRFNTDHTHFHPDALDEAYILRRKDNLYEVVAGLTWELATTWNLQPRVIYLHDRSNLDDFHYGSLEYWVSVRKSFAAD
jgi:hypothetical protein